MNQRTRAMVNGWKREEAFRRATTQPTREESRRVTRPRFTGPTGTIVHDGRTTYRIEGRETLTVMYEVNGQVIRDRQTFAVGRDVTNGHDGRGTERRRIG